CWLVRRHRTRHLLVPFTTLFRSKHAPTGVPERRPPGARTGPTGRGVGTRCPTAHVRLAFPAFFTRTRGTGEDRRMQPRNMSMSRSEEHTSELQSRENLVCRLLLE